MSSSFSAIQQVGILHLAPVAKGVDTGTLQFGTDQIFKDLCITVRPVEASSPYTVTVYHDGEEAETHTYADPADRIIAEMNYPDYVFPANVGTGSPPRYNAFGYVPTGLPITVTISNLAGANKTFEVYATFTVYEVSKFAKSI